MKTEPLGVRDVTRAEGLSASAVTRYLKNHPELNRAEPGQRPRIDLEEFRQHRRDNMNLDVMGAAEMRDAVGSSRDIDSGRERRSPAAPREPTQAKADHVLIKVRLRAAEREQRRRHPGLRTLGHGPVPLCMRVGGYSRAERRSSTTAVKTLLPRQRNEHRGKHP